MRVLSFLSLPASAVVATLVLTASVSTEANARPLCRAPGMPKGCVARPVVRTIPNPDNSYNPNNSYNATSPYWKWPMPQRGPA
jgi:hypothetical protein